MTITVKNGDTTEQYGSTDTHHFRKTTKHVTDKQVSDCAELNQHIKDTKPLGKDMQFEGRIPLWLLENVKNQIYNDLTRGGGVEQEKIWLSKAGQNEIEDMAIDLIYKSNEYAKIMGRA